MNCSPTFVLALLAVCSLTCRADLESGLVGYYPFNGNALDESGNAHHGVVHGAVLTTDRFGNTAQAYQFDGSTAYIQVADSVPLRLANTDFTLSAWVYETARNSSWQDAILTKRGSTTTRSNGWFWSIRGNLEDSAFPVGSLYYQGSGGNDPAASSGTPVPLRGWHHIVTVYDNANHSMKMYVNGVLDCISNNIPSPNPNTSASLHIGHDIADVNNGYHFHGKIDDVRLYNRTLSPAEIWQLANDVLQPAADYFFDDFNRPDSPDIDNGWILATDNITSGDLGIVSNRLSHVTTNDAAICRQFPLNKKTTLSVRFTDRNGYSCHRNRHEEQISIRSDGTRDSGYGIRLHRSDNGYTNSQVTLVDNGIEIDQQYATFQFANTVTVDYVTFNLDGSVERSAL